MKTDTPKTPSENNGSELNIIEGQIRISTKGIGYVDYTDTESVEIAPEFLKTALHKDTVKVLVYSTIVGKNRTGEVVEIVLRNKMSFVGIVKQNANAVFLFPDDTRMYRDILLPQNASTHVGKKVLVKIVSWEDPKLGPTGEVLEVIGTPGLHETEIRAILLERGVEPGFPEEVEKEAEKISKVISEEEIALRRDFRKVTTFTIDPFDAKDFDDALSVEKLPDGNYEVGVHIADVSHYVRPGNAIDSEAKKRGTSIYLVDRTIPMLPEVLSNDLCSLNPNEDKLAFASTFVIDGKAFSQGKFIIISEWFGRTVINSDKRFTYEEAQEILDKKQGLFYEELKLLNDMALIIRDERFKNGAISFEKDEVKFKLDEEGKPIDVYVKRRQDTNKMIEDWMLLANKKVAEFMNGKDGNLKQTFVYRIHDAPDEERIGELALFLKSIGYDLKIGKKGPLSRDINAMLEAIKGRPEENMIQTATIRSMAKAIYSTNNIGHYGLAFEHYTHFTSPIRRYPDLVVHRLLAEYLSGKTIPLERLQEFEILCRHASGMENNASDAERASIKYKQAEYMSTRVGETFDAVISGIAPWGVYVEEKRTKAEGLVPIRTLGNDFYVLDEKKYCIIGERTKERFSLGDEIKVKVSRVDVEKRQIDYALVK